MDQIHSSIALAINAEDYLSNNKTLHVGFIPPEAMRAGRDDFNALSQGRVFHKCFFKRFMVSDDTGFNPLAQPGTSVRSAAPSEPAICDLRCIFEISDFHFSSAIRA